MAWQEQAQQLTASIEQLEGLVTVAKERLDSLARMYWQGLDGKKLKAALTGQGLEITGNKQQMQGRGIGKDLALLVAQ